MPSIKRPLALLLIAVGLAACADLLFYGRAPGISALIFSALLLAALAWLAHEERGTPANRWIGGAALLFAALGALRDSPILLFFNLATAAGLLFLLATVRRALPLGRLDAWRVIGGALSAAMLSAFQPFALAAQAARQIGGTTHPGRTLLVLGRGLLLAVPVLLVFTGLLTLADSIFASYIDALLSFEVPFDLENAIGHGLFISCVGWVLAAGLAMALREVPTGSMLGAAELPAEGETQRLSAPLNLRFLGWGESLMVLGLTDLLFGVFMVVQGTYLFGGADTLARTGMTYAEYARRGFFELLTVAVLALGLLVAAAVVARRAPGREQQTFHLACGLMVALLLGMLGSAAYRMWLYEQAYGFTELRLYTHSFMAWLAVVMLLFLAGLLTARPRLFTHGVPLAAATALLVLNVANPDALIVRWNVERYYASGDLDTYYLARLSGDAVPTMVAALPGLDPQMQTEASEMLGEIRERLDRAAARDGWPGWRLGSARARALLADL